MSDKINGLWLYNPSIAKALSREVQIHEALHLSGCRNIQFPNEQCQPERMKKRQVLFKHIFSCCITEPVSGGQLPSTAFKCLSVKSHHVVGARWRSCRGGPRGGCGPGARGTGGISAMLSRTPSAEVCSSMSGGSFCALCCFPWVSQQLAHQRILSCGIPFLLSGHSRTRASTLSFWI